MNSITDKNSINNLQFQYKEEMEKRRRMQKTSLGTKLIVWSLGQSCRVYGTNRVDDPMQRNTALNNN